jgi:quercetin dioxygenase-like cupin family protein
MADHVAVIDGGKNCPRLPLVTGGGEAFAVVWPGMGARARSMHRVSLRPGSATVPMRHSMEAVYYVIAGEGSVRDLDKGTSDSVIEGSMIHVEPGTAYVCVAGASGMELVGGPCPSDPELYRHLTKPTSNGS